MGISGDKNPARFGITRELALQTFGGHVSCNRQVGHDALTQVSPGSRLILIPFYLCVTVAELCAAGGFGPKMTVPLRIVSDRSTTGVNASSGDLLSENALSAGGRLHRKDPSGNTSGFVADVLFRA